MNSYKDVNGDSGVIAYEHGEDFIKVQFKNGAVYHYDYASAGSTNIEKMKELAVAGDGLNAFINKYVRTSYARRER